MESLTAPRKIACVLRGSLPKPVLALVRSVRARLLNLDCHRSYAQEGEDMILRRIFEGKTKGFYVDVGAHHPTRFSNTYFFYRLGWSGINIDAMPGSMQAFRKLRPNDTNVEAAIAKERGELTFSIFDEPALNTFDTELAQLHKNNSVYRLVSEKRIVTDTLGEVLKRHLPAGQTVDFLSTDVEGLDFEVLQSNDWSLCQPRCIVSESLGTNFELFEKNPMHEFLRDKGYRPFAKTVNTMIFLRDTP